MCLTHQATGLAPSYVTIEDILMRTDHMMILRPCIGGEHYIIAAIKCALSIVGKPYDFGFDFKDCNRFSCTELVSYCYPGLVEPKKRALSFGKSVIVADDFRDSKNLTIIWSSISSSEDNQS